MSFDFARSNGNYLKSIGYLFGLTNTNPRPVTIFFRLKQNSTDDQGNGNSQWIIQNDHGTGGNPSLAIGIGGGATNKLRLFSGGYSDSSTWTPDTSRFHNYMVSWTSGGTITFYRDAILIGTASRAVGGSSATGWQVGRLNGLGGFNIDGHLADLAVWNVALGQHEAALLQRRAPWSLHRDRLVFCLPLRGELLREIGGAPWTLSGSLIQRADLFTSIVPIPPKRRFHLLNSAAAGGSTVAHIIGGGYGSGQAAAGFYIGGD